MLVLTFTVTVALDLVTAVAVGVGVAIVLALRAVARTARIEQVPLEPGDHSAEEHALLAEHIVAYRLDGPLFFAAAHTFLLQLSEITDVRVVILRMSRVSTVDATGAHVLGDAINRLQRRGITVLLSGIAPGHEEVLNTLGVAERPAPRGTGLPRHPHRHRRTPAPSHSPRRATRRSYPPTER